LETYGHLIDGDLGPPHDLRHPRTMLPRRAGTRAQGNEAAQRAFAAPSIGGAVRRMSRRPSRSLAISLRRARNHAHGDLSHADRLCA
jgi:hypothetical protein